jgi:hypothetical protein
MGQMQHCARALCRKIMTLQWNMWAMFNFTIASHLIVMTEETLAVELTSYTYNVQSGPK